MKVIPVMETDLSWKCVLIVFFQVSVIITTPIRFENAERNSTFLLSTTSAVVTVRLIRPGQFLTSIYCIQPQHSAKSISIPVNGK